MPNLITLTGPSGAGKSTVVNMFLENNAESFNPVLVPKFTTRAKRKDDNNEILHVKKLPDTCNLTYEQYGYRYGQRLELIFDHLAKGLSPLIILNDVRTVQEVRTSLGTLVKSIFIFREAPSIESYEVLSSNRGVDDEQDLQRRFQKAQAIYRIYIENIYIFDHVILNSGTLSNLEIQINQIVLGLQLDNKWPLKERS